MAEKFLKIQQQIRHDNTDLEDYIRDLKSWEKEIKKKDDTLRHEKLTEDVILPPVRNQTKQKSSQHKHKKTKVNGGKSEMTIEPQNGKHSASKERIKAYDYKSWDKFDVDKACAEIDSDGEPVSRSTLNDDDSETSASDVDSEDDKVWERQRQIQEANMEKEKGNMHFKKGAYEESMVCYTAGIKADCTNAILPANRAMAQLKLKRFQEAEEDCDKSISLDCTYIKAYARRAAARRGLGRLEDAKKDYRQVLNLEPSNKQAKSEIKRIDGILKERADAERQKLDGVYNIIQAVQKPVHLRSKKPMRRMVIQEIGTGEGDYYRPTISDPRTLTTDDLSKLPDQTSTDSEDQDSSSRLANQDQGSTCRVSGQADPAGTTDSQQVEPSAKVTSPDRTQPSVQPGPPEPTNSSSPSLTSPVTPTGGPPVPAIPTSSYQLQTNWKILKGHPEKLFQYFKRIPPSTYPQLFQQALDSTLLLQILALLQDEYIKHEEPVYECLKNLSCVKRFDMNIMFMSSEDEKVVQNLFKYAKRFATESADDLKSLAKKYGL